MNCSVVDQIARAVLYEGYILYPYRQSALKNQQRWNFGVLYPPAWAANQTGSDRSYFQMECLAECSEQRRVDVSIRFLQSVTRESITGEWQEGVERKVSVNDLAVAELSASAHIENFSLPPLEGQISISATRIKETVFRLTVRVTNVTAAQSSDRNEALLHSLASAHCVATLHGGGFVSQIDPPEDLRDAVTACQNIGVWPVLVGKAGTTDTMLGSPIILYDYPQIAPESKGDLFDATEIDEILILRILTLTEEEKDEVRRSDPRARRILERLESSPPEHLLELHGKIRSMQPVDQFSGLLWKKGDRVRLRPRKRADIFDTLLEGKIAIVEAVEQDY
ncbi:MAG: hypothetical protein JO097_01330, partial [Acidobacteriaceae bacterium]|nr:hypothetical protein [Acidobacteriaceae bacterium]